MALKHPHHAVPTVLFSWLLHINSWLQQTHNCFSHILIFYSMQKWQLLLLSIVCSQPFCCLCIYVCEKNSLSQSASALWPALSMLQGALSSNEHQFRIPDWEFRLSQRCFLHFVYNPSVGAEVSTRFWNCVVPDTFVQYAQAYYWDAIYKKLAILGGSMTPLPATLWWRK